MLLFGSINSDANAQVINILLNKLLDLLFMVVDTICRKRESIGVKPVMIPAIHFRLQIVAYLIYQFHFQKWLTTNEVPYHTFFSIFFFMVKDIVNCLFSYIKRHSLFFILTNQVAIFTCKLAIFGNNESNGFCNTILPCSSSLFYCFFHSSFYYKEQFYK